MQIPPTRRDMPIWTIKRRSEDLIYSLLFLLQTARFKIKKETINPIRNGINIYKMKPMNIAKPNGQPPKVIIYNLFRKKSNNLTY